MIAGVAIERGRFTVDAEDERSPADARARRHRAQAPSDCVEGLRRAATINVATGIARRHVVSAVRHGQALHGRPERRRRCPPAKLLLEQRGSHPGGARRRSSGAEDGHDRDGQRGGHQRATTSSSATPRTSSSATAGRTARSRRTSTRAIPRWPARSCDEPRGDGSSARGRSTTRSRRARRTTEHGPSDLCRAPRAARGGHRRPARRVPGPVRQSRRGRSTATASTRRQFADLNGGTRTVAGGARARPARARARTSAPTSSGG